MPDDLLLDPRLREAFLTAAQALERDPAALLNDVVRDFVEERTQRQAFLQAKHDKAMASFSSGSAVPDREVRSMFATLRGDDGDDHR